jgi:hypothetical protein
VVQVRRTPHAWLAERFEQVGAAQERNLGLDFLACAVVDAAEHFVDLVVEV